MVDLAVKNDIITIMDEKMPESTERHAEPPIQQLVFESLFPGQDFAALPRSNVRRKIRFVVDLLVETNIMKRAKIIDAILGGKRAKERIEFTHPYQEQVMLAFETGDLSAKRISSGALRDQLKTNEKLGGVAVLDLGDTQGQFYKADVIGVLDEHGQPTAYILFSEGLRGGKKIRSSVQKRNYSPVLKPVGNRSGLRTIARI